MPLALNTINIYTATLHTCECFKVLHTVIHKEYYTTPELV